MEFLNPNQSKFQFSLSFSSFLINSFAKRIIIYRYKRLNGSAAIISKLLSALSKSLLLTAFNPVTVVIKLYPKNVCVFFLQGHHKKAQKNLSQCIYTRKGYIHKFNLTTYKSKQLSDHVVDITYYQFFEFQKKPGWH